MQCLELFYERRRTFPIVQTGSYGNLNVIVTGITAFCFRANNVLLDSVSSSFSLFPDCLILTMSQSACVQKPFVPSEKAA